MCFVYGSCIMFVCISMLLNASVGCFPHLLCMLWVLWVFGCLFAYVFAWLFVCLLVWLLGCLLGCLVVCLAVWLLGCLVV